MKKLLARLFAKKEEKVSQHPMCHEHYNRVFSNGFPCSKCDYTMIWHPKS